MIDRDIQDADGCTCEYCILDRVVVGRDAVIAAADSMNEAIELGDMTAARNAAARYRALR